MSVKHKQNRRNAQRFNQEAANLAAIAHHSVLQTQTHVESNIMTNVNPETIDASQPSENNATTPVDVAKLEAESSVETDALFNQAIGEVNNITATTDSVSVATDTDDDVGEGPTLGPMEVIQQWITECNINLAGVSTLDHTKLDAANIITALNLPTHIPLSIIAQAKSLTVGTMVEDKANALIAMSLVFSGEEGVETKLLLTTLLTYAKQYYESSMKPFLINIVGKLKEQLGIVEELLTQETETNETTTPVQPAIKLHPEDDLKQNYQHLVGNFDAYYAKRNELYAVHYN